jgi:small subunit ribosomal protein S16
MLMIRFQRIGRKNDPAFRIAVLEKERAAKAGGIVAQVGTYNPKTKALTLDAEAVKSWISKGAQPTDSVHNLLLAQGVITGAKRNVLPKKTVPKKEEPAAEPAPSAAAASEAVPSAEAAPVEAAAEPEAAPEETAEAAPEEAPAA